MAAGLTLPGRDLADIDKHWLRTQYLTHGRSLEDVVHELGIRAHHVGRRARQYGIPLRPPKARKATSDQQDYPAILSPAARSYGWQRLLRFRPAMKHRTMAEAPHSALLVKPLPTKSPASNGNSASNSALDHAPPGQRVTPPRFGQSVLDAIETICAHTEPATN